VIVVVSRPMHFIASRRTGPIAGAQVVKCESSIHDAKPVQRKHFGGPGVGDLVTALDQTVGDPAGGALVTVRVWEG
jgi:hypothetical protein